MSYQVLSEIVELNKHLPYSVSGNSTHGFYIFVACTVTKEIRVNGKIHTVVYNTGMSNDYGDYNCPTNDFEVENPNDEIKDIIFENIPSLQELAISHDMSDYNYKVFVENGNFKVVDYEELIEGGYFNSIYDVLPKE